jgi:diketogulonate reductase-like aldo/keto reductase
MTTLTIPQLAFGTGNTREYYVGKNEESIDEEYVKNIASAIRAGFCHIDTAESYGTERTVASAIKLSGVPREKLYITTKVLQHIEDPEAALHDSLHRLNVDYLDCYLIHNPYLEKFGKTITRKQAWQTLEKMKDKGLVKSIGVSNYQIKHLEELLQFARIKPAVNQIEFHPNLQQEELIDFMKKHDIAFSVYGALAPLISKDPQALIDTVQSIADKHHKTTTQVLIRWALQKGATTVVTSSTKDERIKELLDSTSFELSPDEVDAISKEGNTGAVRKYWPQGLFDK